MTTPHPEEHQIPPPETEPTPSSATRESSLFEGRQYEDEARRRWDRRIFSIKLDFLNTVSGLALWSVRAVGLLLLLIVLYMICLVAIHYTVPSAGWLSPEDLVRLEGIYGRAANVGAPVMLMANAWIIWWMSRTRRGE